MQRKKKKAIKRNCLKKIRNKNSYEKIVSVNGKGYSFRIREIVKTKYRVCIENVFFKDYKELGLFERKVLLIKAR